MSVHIDKSSLFQEALPFVTGEEMLDRLCAPAGDPSPPPRTLLALAHPDDETVGASSRLTRIEAAAFLYATDGAPRDGRDARAAGCASIDDYADMRRSETLRALAHVGVTSERAVFLGYPDQQAAYRLLPLTADLRRWIIATRPEIVLTHPYEGGHPDHDAVAFAVHAAVAALTHEDAGAPPVVIEFTSYHARGNERTFAEFLPAPESPERTVRLTPDGQALKKRLLACHRSQAAKWKSMPLAEERFRLAPAYDFTRPPHDGQALYERFAGITAKTWCELAAEANDHLAQAHHTCVLK
jgi:LmbE family N-acetylglucosaminyl deacetylase